MSFQLIDFLISQLSPEDYLLQGSPEATFLKFIILIHVPHVAVSNIENMSNNFWELCHNKIKNNETYQYVLEDNEKLLEEAKSVKELLIDRIQKTFKL